MQHKGPARCLVSAQASIEAVRRALTVAGDVVVMCHDGDLTEVSEVRR
jgi:dihydroxyacid dehydratase/phosphogluconate dehydratase